MLWILTASVHPAVMGTKWNENCYYMNGYSCRKLRCFLPREMRLCKNEFRNLRVIDVKSAEPTWTVNTDLYPYLYNIYCTPAIFILVIYITVSIKCDRHKLYRYDEAGLVIALKVVNIIYLHIYQTNISIDLIILLCTGDCLIYLTTSRATSVRGCNTHRI